ncbi:MAG: hypothetical protein M5U28_02900 [Sandaracinaceae bacterium]|nr:hypothetical protein [Sandaracinaceae bacterium]
MRSSSSIFAFLLLLSASGCVDTRPRGNPRDTGGGGDAGGCGLLTDCDGVCADLASSREHCGGCGTACADGEACFGGLCAPCTASCEERECGDDGCGGSCGTCATGESCLGGYCEAGCVPDCEGADCGSDGCGGTCGSCPFGTVCEDRYCVDSCVPSCEGRECGSDGCGGSCGSCPFGTVCVDESYCEETCSPSCSGRECGSDGCGGSCGTCPSGTTCNTSGACVSTCTPSCSGRSCGSDGCGGSCGTCPSGTSCDAFGACVSTSGTGESCSSPTAISTSGGSYSFSFTGRVGNHTPLSCGSTSGMPDVAFRVTPSFSGTATFVTSGSNDTVMALYSSSTCTTSLACDDDGAGVGTNSRISYSVSAGVTYYVVIAQYSGTTASGSSTLTVTLP